MQLVCMSYWKLQKISATYLKESQIANGLANVVVAKVKIIDNHAVASTLLITLVIELAATNKKPVNQLMEALGRYKNYIP